MTVGPNKIFLQEYQRTGNAAQAYRDSFDCSGLTASAVCERARRAIKKLQSTPQGENVASGATHRGIQSTPQGENVASGFSTIQTAAQEYINLGFHLIPIHPIVSGRCGCGRADCGSPGKHPIAKLVPHGLKDASNDPVTIAKWLASGTINLAVATGAISGLWALDMDDGGEKTLDELEEQNGKLPSTWCQETGSGGTHLLFRHPCVPVKNSVKSLGKGLDVRGDGGYILIPPSNHKSGNVYWWIHPPGGKHPLSDAATWLLDLINQPKATPKNDKPAPRTAPNLGNLSNYAAAAIAGECREVATASVGTRNNTLNKAAVKLGHYVAGAEMPLETIEQSLLSAAAQAGIPETEAKATIASGIKAGMCTPKRCPQPGEKASKKAREHQADAQPGQFADGGQRLKPIIQIFPGENPRAMRQAETALLNSTIEIFQRMGMLVRVSRIPKSGIKHSKIRDDENAVEILPINQPWLELTLDDQIRFEKFDGRQQATKQIDCPPEIPRALLANAGAWRFHPLAGVIEAPTLRPDGSILETPGFDDQTNLYLDTCGQTFPPIPQNPTREEAIAALHRAESIISEFPFRDTTHKAAALSVFMTALVRKSLRTAPMFAFSAPTPASGKSLLADCVSLMALGRPCPAVTRPKDPAEEKKIIFTLLMRGDAMVLIDNISTAFESDILCSVLSQEQIQDRVLGETRNVICPTNMLWMATGNNISIKGDLSTRVILIHIDPALEDPENRTFQKNLKTWIPRNRLGLVVDGLTALRAYRVAGMPPTGLKPYGRFEEWARVIRDCLVWCGYPDVCATRIEVTNDDPVHQHLRSLYLAWWDAIGSTPTTIADLIKKAREMATRSERHTGDYMTPSEEKAKDEPALLNIIQEIAGDARGNIDNRKFGFFLRGHKGRIEAGYKTDNGFGTSRDKVVLWELLNVNPNLRGMRGIAGYSTTKKFENDNTGSSVYNMHACENRIYRAEDTPQYPAYPALIPTPPSDASLGQDPGLKPVEPWEKF